MLGLIWAVRHVIPLLPRMIMMWGTPIMVVFHASANIAYVLPPNGGTHYESIFVASIVVLVAVVSTVC